MSSFRLKIDRILKKLWQKVLEKCWKFCCSFSTLVLGAKILRRRFKLESINRGSLASSRENEILKIAFVVLCFYEEKTFSQPCLIIMRDWLIRKHYFRHSCFDIPRGDTWWTCWHFEDIKAETSVFKLGERLSCLLFDGILSRFSWVQPQTKTIKMVGKMGETCPQCKQFRMLCMCAVTSDRDRKGRMGRRVSTERALAFAQSLAVWRRRTRRPRGPRGPLTPSRQSSLRTIPTTPSIPAGKRRITFSHNSSPKGHWYPTFNALE